MTYTFTTIDSPFSSYENKRLEGAIFDNDTYISGYFNINIDEDTESVILSRGGDVFIADMKSLVINGDPAAEDVKDLLQQLTIFSPKEEVITPIVVESDWGDVVGDLSNQEDLWGMLVSGSDNVTITKNTATNKVSISVSDSGLPTWGTITSPQGGNISAQADLWQMLTAGANITLTPNLATGKITIAATGTLASGAWGQLTGDISTQDDLWEMIMAGDDSINITRDATAGVVKIKSILGNTGCKRLTKSTVVSETTYTITELVNSVTGVVIAYEIKLPTSISVEYITDVFFMSSSIDSYVKSLNYTPLIDVSDAKPNCIYVQLEEAEEYDIILINGIPNVSSSLVKVAHNTTLVGDGTAISPIGVNPAVYKVKDIIVGQGLDVTVVNAASLGLSDDPEEGVYMLSNTINVSQDPAYASPTDAASISLISELISSISNMNEAHLSGPYDSISEIDTPYQQNYIYMVGIEAPYLTYAYNGVELKQIGSTEVNLSSYPTVSDSDNAYIVKDDIQKNIGKSVYLTNVSGLYQTQINAIGDTPIRIYNSSSTGVVSGNPFFRVGKDISMKLELNGSRYFQYDQIAGLQVTSQYSNGLVTLGNKNYQDLGGDINSVEAITPSRVSLNDFKARAENRGQGNYNKLAINDTNWKVKNILPINHVTAINDSGTWTIGHDGYKNVDYVANLFLVTNPSSYTLPSPSNYDLGTVFCAIVEGPNSFYHPRGAGSYIAVNCTYRLSDPYANSVWPFEDAGEHSWRTNPRVTQAVRDKGIKRIGYMCNEPRSYTTGFRYNMMKQCFWNQYTETYPDNSQRQYSGATASDGIILEAIQFQGVGNGNYCTPTGYTSRQVEVRSDVGRNYTTGWGQLNKTAKFVIFDKSCADNSGQLWVFRCDEDAMTGAYTKSIAWGGETNSGVGDRAILHLMDDTYYSFHNGYNNWNDIGCNACINIDKGYIPYKWYYVGKKADGTIEWKQYWPDIAVNDTVSGVVIPALPNGHSVLGQWEKATGNIFMTQNLTGALDQFDVTYTTRTTVDIQIPEQKETTVSAGNNVAVTSTTNADGDTTYTVGTTFNVLNSLESTSTTDALSASAGKDLAGLIAGLETKAWMGPYGTVPQVPTPYSSNYIYLVGSGIPYSMYVLMGASLTKIGETSTDLSNYYTKANIDGTWKIKELVVGNSFTLTKSSGTYTLNLANHGYWNEIGNVVYGSNTFTFTAASGDVAGVGWSAGVGTAPANINKAFLGIASSSNPFGLALQMPYVGVLGTSKCRYIDNRNLGSSENQVISVGDLDSGCFSVDATTHKVTVVGDGDAQYGIPSVTHDTTLSGAGTADSPLGVVGLNKFLEARTARYGNDANNLGKGLAVTSGLLTGNKYAKLILGLTDSSSKLIQFYKTTQEGYQSGSDIFNMDADTGSSYWNWENGGTTQIGVRYSGFAIEGGENIYIAGSGNSLPGSTSSPGRHVLTPNRMNEDDFEIKEVANDVRKLSIKTNNWKVKNIVGGSNVTVSNSNGTFTINSTGGGGGGSDVKIFNPGSHADATHFSQLKQLSTIQNWPIYMNTYQSFYDVQFDVLTHSKSIQDDRLAGLFLGAVDLNTQTFQSILTNDTLCYFPDTGYLYGNPYWECVSTSYDPSGTFFTLLFQTTLKFNNGGEETGMLTAKFESTLDYNTSHSVTLSIVYNEATRDFIWENQGIQPNQSTSVEFGYIIPYKSALREAWTSVVTFPEGIVGNYSVFLGESSYGGVSFISPLLEIPSANTVVFEAMEFRRIIVM